MKMSFKHKVAFTISEAVITMVILGIIAILLIPVISFKNPMNKGNKTLVRKNAEAIEQAALQIIVDNCVFDKYTQVKDENGYFSIEDPDAKERMSALFKSHINYLDTPVDIENEYFGLGLMDVQKNDLGIDLRSAYSGFFWNMNGALVGFRFYEGCDNIEYNANVPEQKGVSPIVNICGSIFFDINGYKKPNLIGNDQYILPISNRGIKYMNE